jgi:hypothetical protein
MRSRRIYPVAEHAQNHAAELLLKTLENFIYGVLTGLNATTT